MLNSRIYLDAIYHTQSNNVCQIAFIVSITFWYFSSQDIESGKNRSNTVDLRKQLGSRIRLFREAYNLTQEDLAERANLSVTFIGTTERGKNIPSIKTCKKIAEVLGVPLHELLKFEEQTEHEKRVEQFALRLKGASKKKVRIILEIGDVILKKG